MAGWNRSNLVRKLDAERARADIAERALREMEVDRDRWRAKATAHEAKLRSLGHSVE
jgi:hypothetical protein